jgi:O-antigen/teichoic acid export membrane protein
MYGMGVVLSKAVAMIMLPVYTRYLTPADYGVLQLVAMTIEVISIIAGSRIATGIFHFYHKEVSEDGRRAVLSTAFFLLVVAYGVVCLAAFAAAPWIAGLVIREGPNGVTFVRVALAALAFESFFFVPVAYMQLHQRSGWFVTVQMVKLVIQLALNVVLLIPLGLGVLGVLISTLAANLLVGGVMAGLLLREVGIHVRAPIVRRLLRFGVPLMAMHVAAFVVSFGDRYFLNRAGGPEAVGLYGLAYQFGLLSITVAGLPFGLVWDPLRFGVAKRPDRDAVYARVFVYFNLLLVTLAVMIALLGGDVVRVMADEAFHPAGRLIPLLVAVFVLHAWAEFLNLGMLITERTELVTVGHWLAAGVAMVGYLVVVPRFLAVGTALVVLAAFGTRFATSYYFSQRVWPIRYRWAPVLRLIALGVLVCGISQVLPQMHLAWSLLADALLILAYGAGAYAFGGLSHAERAALRGAVRSPLTFLRDLRVA